MDKEIIIFIGYSIDAKKEANLIHGLEGHFQRAIRRFNHNQDYDFSSLRMFLWEIDAPIAVGGQQRVINPDLNNASIAIFVFKHRIGTVTWQELQDCRERKIPIICLFPKNPPPYEELNKLDVVKEWNNLLTKKQQLTDGWNKENSQAITPVEDYNDNPHLLSILKDRMPDAFLEVIQKYRKIRNIDAIFSQQDKGQSSNLLLFQDQNPFNLPFLDKSSSVQYFQEEIVQDFRNILREEKKKIFPVSLENGQFLIKEGYWRHQSLTLTGVLLFTERPSLVIPSAYIRAVKYEGAIKASPRNRVDIDGPIFKQIEEARAFIERNIPSRDVVSNNSSITEKIYEYPMKCIRELIANAICHREYKDSERIVYIRIFSDRIEISNPGKWGNQGLEEGKKIPINEISNEPVENNISLAKAISSINMMEMEGSGIPTALSDCESSDAPIPDIIQTNDSVKVTIYPRKNWASELSTIDCNGIRKDTNYIFTFGEFGAGKTTINGMIALYIVHNYLSISDPKRNESGNVLMSEIQGDLKSGKFPRPTVMEQVINYDLQIKIKDEDVDLSFLEISGEDLTKMLKPYNRIPSYIKNYLSCPEKAITFLLVVDYDRLIGTYEGFENPDDLFHKFLSYIYRLNSEKGKKYTFNLILVVSKFDMRRDDTLLPDLVKTYLPRTYQQIIALPDSISNVRVFPFTVGEVAEDSNGYSYIKTLDLNGSAKNLGDYILESMTPPKKKTWINQIFGRKKGPFS